MKVLVQWTRQDPTDWEEMDSSQWDDLPSRPIPMSGELGGQDDTPGWVYALNVQGVIFTGHDHYHVEDISGGCRVTVWDDDPDEDRPVPWVGQRWTFLDPAPDPRYGGAINTRQSIEYWHDVPVEGAGSGGSHQTHAPIDFVPPVTGRHGIWVPDSKKIEHNARRSSRGWREWTE